MTDPIPANEVAVHINQLALPNDLGLEELQEWRHELNGGDLRTDVVLDKTGDDRVLFVVPAVVLVVHFLSAHAVEIALGAGEAGLYDGIKRVFNRLHTASDSHGSARAVVRYKNGPAIEVDVANADDLRKVLETLVKEEATDRPASQE